MAGARGGQVPRRLGPRPVADGRLTWHAGSFAELLALDAAVVAVDMPFGLPPDGRRREADVAARRLLGVQRASVFLAPPRAALHATSQSDATRLSRALPRTGCAPSTCRRRDRIGPVRTTGLDAVAAAWSGDRWDRAVADVLGGELDATVLPMRIVA